MHVELFDRLRSLCRDVVDLNDIYALSSDLSPELVALLFVATSYGVGAISPVLACC